MTKTITTLEAVSPLDRADEPSEREPEAGQPVQAGEDTAGGVALALHMGVPGTRLDMVLAGPHPLLVDLVRRLAHAAAQADHT